MAELSLNLPVVGEKDTTAEPKVTTALSEIQTQFNGKIAAINLEAKAVTEEKLSTALKEDLLVKSGTTAANTEVKTGELLFVTAAAHTITLPAPAKGAVCAVYAAYQGTGETTVKQHAAEKLFGDYIIEVNEFKLLALQHVILQSDGSSWFIIAGEPKREQKYENKAFTKGEIEGGIEFSSTRPVIFSSAGGSEISGAEVGGQPVFTTGPVFVPPGQKFVATTTKASLTMSFIKL